MRTPTSRVCTAGKKHDLSCVVCMHTFYVDGIVQRSEIMKTVSNKVYDWMKAIGQVLLPELVAFVLVYMKANSINTEIVAPVLAQFIVVWNAIVMTWNKVYHDEQQAKANDFDVNDESIG